MDNPAEHNPNVILVPSSDSTGLVLLGRLGVLVGSPNGNPKLVDATFPADYKVITDSCPTRVVGPNATAVIHYDDEYIEVQEHTAN